MTERITYHKEFLWLPKKLSNGKWAWLRTVTVEVRVRGDVRNSLKNEVDVSYHPPQEKLPPRHRL